MGFVEKFTEIEKAHEELCEQLYDKICFIHENIGKDYRTQDCWFDSRSDIIDVKEKDGFAVITYEYFRYELYDDDIYIKKELLDMSEEDILKNKDILKSELEAYNQEQLKRLEDAEKEEKLQAKKREYERLQKQLKQLESDLGK